MKCTLFVTQQCNLACQYCYIRRRPSTMAESTARSVIDFVFRHAPQGEQVDIGFFGGEPLLKFQVIKAITRLIEEHPSFDPGRVSLTIVTNGTVFSDEIAEFVIEHHIGFGVSCDGPPEVHDVFRRFRNGSGSSAKVVRTIRQAVDAFSSVMVNAVYHPRTFRNLSETVRFLSSLGVRQIYLNPDFSAPWRPDDADELQKVYDDVGRQYIDYYRRSQPHFISLIDGKIAAILRGGYKLTERCRMGTLEFAFTPDGGIYPCERLVGSGDDRHRIGHIDHGVQPACMSCHLASGEECNPECLSCGIRDYCMNWCGCSNYFSSGFYNRVGGFLCASEKAAVRTATRVLERLDGSPGVTFSDHVSGYPLLNSICK